MRIVVEKQNVRLILSMQEKAKLLSSKRWEEDAFRGVVDAGRMTKTRVQRAVRHQMAMIKYGFVAQNTRGTPKRAQLAYEIYAFKGGQKIEDYAGLKALSSGGRAAKRFNSNRAIDDRGFVRSGVWNKPRTFKRSFAHNGGFFAMLPGGNRTTAPKSLWTYGLKPDQPRDGLGRFASPGRTYGRIRRLFGGALSKELAKDESLPTFQKVAPALLSEKVMKRLAKYLEI